MGSAASMLTLPESKMTITMNEDVGFSHIYVRLFSWIEGDDLSFKGELNEKGKDDLDLLIFDLFDVGTPAVISAYKKAHALHVWLSLVDVEIGQKDLAWLMGPNGLTLFKTLVLRKQCTVITWGKNGKRSDTRSSAKAVKAGA